jgi:glutamate synthase (NADPH/NADH) small chain
MAIAEAQRCLQCKKPLCVEGCPVNVSIPEFIKEVADGNFLKAIEIIKDTNSLCQLYAAGFALRKINVSQSAFLEYKGEPVAIGKLEGFVADYEREVLHLPLISSIKKQIKRLQ